MELKIARNAQPTFALSPPPHAVRWAGEGHGGGEGGGNGGVGLVRRDRWPQEGAVTFYAREKIKTPRQLCCRRGLSLTHVSFAKEKPSRR